MNYKKILEKRIDKYVKESLGSMTCFIERFKNKIDEPTIDSVLSLYNQTLEMKSLVDLYIEYDPKDKTAKKLQGALELLTKEGERAIKQGLLNAISK